MKLENITLSDLIMDDFNDPEVRYQMALCYLNGTGGTSRNTEEGMTLMNSAANQGNYSAIKYMEEKVGPVTSDNLAQWCVWAERSDPEAMFQVAAYLAYNAVPGVSKDVCRYVSGAAAQGHAEALGLLVDELDEVYRDELAAHILKKDQDEEEEVNPLGYNRNLAAVLADEYANSKNHRSLTKSLYWRQIFYGAGGKPAEVSDEAAGLECYWPELW